MLTHSSSEASETQHGKNENVSIQHSLNVKKIETGAKLNHKAHISGSLVFPVLGLNLEPYEF